MKKILPLFAIIFIQSIYSYSQTDSFWGIKFGTNKDSVLRYIKENKFVEPTSKDGYQIKYTNVNFGGRRSIFVSLFFCDGLLCQGCVRYSNSPLIYDDPELIIGIKSALISKYGEPTKNDALSSEWKYPNAVKYQTKLIGILLFSDKEFDIMYETPEFSRFLSNPKETKNDW